MLNPLAVSGLFSWILVDYITCQRSLKTPAIARPAATWPCDWIGMSISSLAKYSLNIQHCWLQNCRPKLLLAVLINIAMRSISFQWKKQHLSSHKLISDNRAIQNKLFLFQEKQLYFNWSNTGIIWLCNRCVESLECHDFRLWMAGRGESPKVHWLIYLGNIFRLFTIW